MATHNSGLATLAGTVVFSAKLPDDIDADEFGALIRAISILDDQIVGNVLNSPEAEILNRELRGVEPSVVKRVQYGSDFETILSLMGPPGVIAAVIVGSWIGVAKGLDFLANAGLKNEERLDKRDHRRARRGERALAEQTLGSSVTYMTFGDLVVRRGNQPARATEQFMQKQALGAMEQIVPNETAVDLINTLPDELQNREVIVALTQLAEYGVKIHITPPDRAA